MNTKLKCLLLDDELPGLAYLKMLCGQIPGLEVVKAFNHPETMVAEIARLDFDFCILDIEMPGMSGLQVANLLGGKPVIFTTAYKEYAAEAFDLDAVDYVRKPIQMERLQQAVAKVAAKLANKVKGRQFFQCNTNEGKAVVFIDQLSYIKASDTDSRDKLAQLSDGNMLLLKNISFEKLIQYLPAQDFARVNKKEIIALKNVRVFSFDEITTNIPSPAAGMLKLSLGDVYRAEFVAKLKV